MTLTLDIPDDVLAAVPVPGPQKQRFLMLKIASMLFARDLLSLGRAAELAGITKPDFRQEIGACGIARHYSENKLAAVLAYAHGA